MSFISVVLLCAGPTLGSCQASSDSHRTYPTEEACQRAGLRVAPLAAKNKLILVPLCFPVPGTPT